MTFWGSSHI